MHRGVALKQGIGSDERARYVAASLLRQDGTRLLLGKRSRCKKAGLDAMGLGHFWS